MSHRCHLLPLLLVLACPSPEPDPPEATPDLGWDPAVEVPPGEARAGVLRAGAAGEAAAFGGIGSEARPGDLKIENSQVRFVIQGPWRSHGYVDSGGGVIDADLQRPLGVPGVDVIEDLFLSFGVGRLFHAESVVVVRDGTDGGPAVVRAEGGDVNWSFIEGAIEAEDPLVPPLGLHIVQTYTLAPGDQGLLIETELQNLGDESVGVTPVDGWLAGQEVLYPWVLDRGFDEDLPDTLSAAGGGGRSFEPSFALVRAEGTWDPIALSALASSAGLIGLGWGMAPIPAGGSVTLQRRLVIAADTLALDAALRAARAEPVGTIAGTVRDAAGLGIAGVRVHAVATGSDPFAPRVAGFTTTAVDGTYAATLPVGAWDLYATADAELEHVDLPEGASQYGPFAAPRVNDQVLALLDGREESPFPTPPRGHPTPPPIAVVVQDGGAVSADFVLEDAGAIHLTVLDGAGAPLPATVSLRWSDGVRPGGVLPGRLPRAVGLPDSAGGEAGWAWVLDGETTIPVLPGTYDLVVGSSFRHERESLVQVEVAPGGETSLSVTLEEVIDREGWMALDGHLHAAPSNDGDLPMADRILTCAANGIELPVATDHDREADYGPIVTALGLGDRLRSIPGVEVSPVLRGHFNLYPTVPRGREVSNGGAPDWWTIPQNTDELLARIRTSGDAGALIQVNHGRGTGLMDFGDFGRSTGTSGNPDFWSWNFDLFELINGGGNGNWEEERLDWFSWLNHGHRKVPTGVSDSHSRTSDCGYGRTDVYLGTDNVAEVTAEMVRDAMAAGHVVVAGGVTLRATVTAGTQTLLPGDEATWDSPGEVTVHVRVQSPSWMEPTELRVLRNGEVVQTRALPGAGQGVERLVEDIVLSADPGSWLAVEVVGGPALGSNWGGSVPYAMTNAFFLGPSGSPSR